MSRLTWPGRVERIGDDKRAKGADAQKVEGKVGEEDRNCDGGCMKRPRKREKGCLFYCNWSFYECGRFFF